KSLDRFPGYVEHLVARGIRRDHTLIAIGGGVIQDITCFLAATLLRGVAWKYHPTTLLSQADSCIGSKSSINAGKAKNILGTFTPPAEVFVGARFLATLAAVDVRSAIDDSTPLHVAAHAGRIDIVRLLIAKGADIGARAQGGITPMHMAALGGHAGIVKLLLSLGADVNTLSSSDSTPLHLAAREGHAKLVGLLLRRGAEIDFRRYYGPTPLMEAARTGHIEAVAVLLRSGADLKPRSASSFTALGLARAAGHAAVADLLQRQGASE
ncbi:MAG: ankyrin repeat domain-containing protein, partial [Proteobacteria bacterium]|nr:ankyrin repeat domain-containing protein [Pseudomonadota bacterium]